MTGGAGLLIVDMVLPFGVLIFLGVPIAFSLALACGFFLAVSGTRIPPVMLANDLFGSIDSVTLLALPTFILAGELLNQCKLTDKLIALALQLVGWIRGGLAHVTIVAAMFFGGINGSALADAATISPIMIPGMIRERYPPAIAAAVVASASIIGAIIPPSIPLVIIGGQLQITVGGLLIAGVIPGIMIALILMSVCWIGARWKGYGEIHAFRGLRPLASAALEAGPATLIPLVIVGGMMLGIFSPNEAGTVAVIYTIVLGKFYYRSLTWTGFCVALRGTVRGTAAALLIVATAVVFGHIITFYNVPQSVLVMMTSLTNNPFLLLLLVILLFIIVGMFMDAVANMIILGPLLLPICVHGLGMHPIQYGVFLALGLLLGVLHPPIGLVLFVVAPVAKVSLERVSLAVLPFIALEMIVLVLIGVFPSITLTLPRMAGFVH
jgi:tripartite ATP-independent transporter DctM subunit